MAAKNTPKSKPAAKPAPAAATAKAKDLPAKKSAKGGGVSLNHNETLLGNTSL